MCTNYTPSSRETLNSKFSAPIVDSGDWKAETYQDYLAPIIRWSASGSRESLLANYGMVPKTCMPPGSKHFSTMNARGETISQLRSYGSAWKSGQLCLVPMKYFFEPNWETGQHVRWRIGMADGEDFAVAGLWREWALPDDQFVFAFTQITINADEHPLMKRFHRSGEEKRSLVIVPESKYDTWLQCREPELARSLLLPFPAEQMRAEPAPRSTVLSRKKEARTTGLPELDSVGREEQGSLF